MVRLLFVRLWLLQSCDRAWRGAGENVYRHIHVCFAVVLSSHESRRLANGMPAA